MDTDIINSKCRIYLTIHSFKNICKIMLYFILIKKAYNFLLIFFFLTKENKMQTISNRNNTYIK